MSAKSIAPCNERKPPEIGKLDLLQARMLAANWGSFESAGGLLSRSPCVGWVNPFSSILGLGSKPVFSGGTPSSSAVGLQKVYLDSVDNLTAEHGHGCGVSAHRWSRSVLVNAFSSRIFSLSHRRVAITWAV
jgi:hypothetical protein